MSYFRYEMTVSEDEGEKEYWFEVCTKDLDTARALRRYCEWLCGNQLREENHERPEKNS